MALQRHCRTSAEVLQKCIIVRTGCAFGAQKMRRRCAPSAHKFDDNEMWDDENKKQPHCDNEVAFCEICTYSMILSLSSECLAQFFCTSSLLVLA